MNKPSTYDYKDPWIKRLIFLPILILLILIIILAILRFNVIWNSPTLFTALNIIFLTITMFIIVVLCVRSYLINHSTTIMLLGSGTLALGFGGLLAGFSILGNNINSTVTIYNTSACISGFFILASTILINEGKLKSLGFKWSILSCYILVMALISVLSYLVYNHLWPVYFIQGSGATIIDLSVLYITIILFLVSAVLLLRNNSLENLKFRRWYAYGLVLISVGLFGVSIQTSVGDPLNWVGRTSQYLGAVYILIAIISSIRITGKWMLPWEQTIYETENRYRQIVETANEGIMMADTSGIVTFVNNKMIEMLGYSKDELLGTDALFLVDKDQTSFIHKRSENRQMGLKESYELKFIRKNGKELWALVSASPLYDRKGKHISNLAMYTDITERKKIEEKHLFQADILSRVQDGIIAVDKNFNIIYWNKVAEKLLGWTEEEVIGKNSGELLQTRVENSNRDNVIEELLKNGHYIGELYYLRKDKTYIPIEINIKSFTNENGEITSILASIHDITERKLKDEELKETVDELIRSNKELERFAYVSSHDLQEPLRMVTLYSQLLERRYKDNLDSDADDFIEYIVVNAKRMKQLIDDLLEYSRVTNKAKEFENVELERVMDIVLNNLSISMAENNVNVTFECLPTVFADQNQMLQVFQNLIANAIKFRGEKPPEIIISAQKGKNNWIFSVSDNGIGIKSEHQNQIFDVFKRLHTKEEYPGTGIGLSIVQKIIKHHEGRIWVESEKGKGSTFYFTIPKV